MEWPDRDYYDHYDRAPVVLQASRPIRNRTRQASDHPHHRPLYLNESGALLAPAVGYESGRHRSYSAAGQRPPPPQVIINNAQYEDHSPVRAHRRRSPHYNYDHDYEERGYSRSPPRFEVGRPRSRVRSRTHGSRDPSPYYHDHDHDHDYEREQRMKRLEELEKKEEERLAKKKLEEQLLLKEAEDAKKKKEKEEEDKRVIEAWNKKQKESAEKEKKAKEEQEKAFRERVKKTFGAAGYPEEYIEDVIKQGEKGEKVKHGGHGEHGPHPFPVHGPFVEHGQVVPHAPLPPHGVHGGHAGHSGHGGLEILDLTRPTYTKVHRKHVSPDTLDMYQLPWEWDEVGFDPHPTLTREITNCGVRAGRLELHHYQAMGTRT